MPNRADELLRDTITTVKGIYSDPEWLEWANAWLSGQDRSAVSAERILRRIRRPANREPRQVLSEDTAERGLDELRDLMAKLPAGIAFAVIMAAVAAGATGNPEDTRPAIDAAIRLFKSFEAVKSFRGP
jgi:hypothetical protein